MTGIETVWSGPGLTIERLVVGPLDNNVYVVANYDQRREKDLRRTDEALLIDAAADPATLLGVAEKFNVTSVLTTHGHWDHVGAAAAFLDAGVPVWIHEGDADRVETRFRPLTHDMHFSVGGSTLRVLHTPGHTPGSVCFQLAGQPILFTGDTLFPGGPGNTKGEGGDFATIIDSLQQLFHRFDDDTIIWPGHGLPTTFGAERQHVSEWIARGW